MSTENALTDANRKIILVDVDLKMFGSMSAKIVMIEVGQKYPNQDRSKIILSKVN